MRRTTPRWTAVLATSLAPLAASSIASAQTPGTVLREQKVAYGSGAFGGVLDDLDQFGSALAPVGDLDGDGITELAVGALGDDQGGFNRGAVWILFLNADGTVRAEEKLGSGAGGFTGALDNFDGFGTSLARRSDLDGDGKDELLIGAPGDDDGGAGRGAVWTVLLAGDGRAKAVQKIGHGSGGFTGALDNNDRFGRSVAELGDLDGDGVRDLVIGADQDGDGGVRRGAVWIGFMNADGTVRTQAKISDTAGGFTGVLDDNDRFGASVAPLGDLDGDGVPDVAVGADQDDDGFSAAGAVWILFLDRSGSVKSHAKLSAASGLPLGGFVRFGGAAASLGDVDGDGVVDLAVGATGLDEGLFNAGGLFVLFLDPAGGLRAAQPIHSLEGGFIGPLGAGSGLGSAVAALGDLDGDRMLELAVGADRDDEGGRDRGAVWVLSLESELLVTNRPPDVILPVSAGVFEAGVDTVPLAASVSDADGDLLSFTWSRDGEVLASGAVRAPAGGAPVELPTTELTTGAGPGADLGLGFHVFTLSVTDGASAPVERELTVEVVDTRAPSLTATADVDLLWPPNGRMVTVFITTDADDASGGAVSLSAAVTSSEPATGRGGPDFTEPLVDSSSGTIEVGLRATRSGKGEGRVYTVTVTATDEAGQSASVPVEIVVPHDQKK